MLHLAVVDRYANPSASFRGRVRLRAFQGNVDLPKQMAFTGTNGWISVRFVPRGVGLVRLRASALGGPLLAVSNPMQVYAKEPERKIYWGDLHSHSHYSWDGVGHDPYDYARFVSGLDFVWADLDRSFRENSIYYVRLRQKSLGWPISTMEPVWHHAIAMAWSSPIRVKKK